jgi:hypothetical protein
MFFVPGSLSVEKDSYLDHFGYSAPADVLDLLAN